jgi:hypothetical protein
MERIREGDETSAKRLPSRRRAITHGNNATNRLENEYEHETAQALITRSRSARAPGTMNIVPRSRKYRGSHGRVQVTR